MDKYNCDQLKNIKVPEKWIENALNVPNEPQKRPLAPVMFYRFAAGIAACVVIAAAVTLSLMFGINKKVDMTAPESEIPSRSNSIIDVTSPTSAPDVSSPSKTPPLLSEERAQGAAVVTEPAESGESESGESGSPTAAQNNKKQSNTKPQTPAKSNSGSNKQAETSTDGAGEKETAEEQTTIDIKSLDPGDWALGGLPDDQPKPTRPPASTVSGCRFLTSVDKKVAEGNSYYCKIQDGSGSVIGSGAAQKCDWGNPDWPIDLKFTANFVLYYDRNYTVTFYNSRGETVWSGTVYLEQGKDSYLLY